MNARVALTCALACAGGLFSGVTIAHAQTATGRPTKPAAITHFQQGNAHYKLRDFEQAVQEYKAAAFIEPAPIFDYNLGQCYRMLARYPDAIWHYKRYLQSGIATPEEATSITTWISEMTAEMEQRAKSTPPTEPATMQPSPTQLAQPAMIDVDAARWYQDALGWGLAGAGIAASGAGAALLVDAGSLRNDANAAPSQQQRDALRDTADSRALTGTILAIGGGALLVTGIIKLAIYDDTRSASTQAARWSVGISRSGAFAFGTF